MLSNQRPCSFRGFVGSLSVLPNKLLDGAVNQVELLLDLSHADQLRVELPSNFSELAGGDAAVFCGTGSAQAPSGIARAAANTVSAMPRRSIARP